jgi:hypothetical protein
LGKHLPARIAAFQRRSVRIRGPVRLAGAHTILLLPRRTRWTSIDRLAGGRVGLGRRRSGRRRADGRSSVCFAKGAAIHSRRRSPTRWRSSAPSRSTRAGSDRPRVSHCAAQAWLDLGADLLRAARGGRPQYRRVELTRGAHDGRTRTQSHPSDRCATARRRTGPMTTSAQAPPRRDPENRRTPSTRRAL